MYVCCTVWNQSGDYIETCWGCFNVNFNAPFKKDLCIGWCKNFDKVANVLYMVTYNGTDYIFSIFPVERFDIYSMIYTLKGIVQHYV